MIGIVIGNSQVGSLRNGAKAMQDLPSLHWYSLPGGNGPNLKMDQRRIVSARPAPPIAVPATLADTGVALQDYDFIVYSGWGLSAMRNRNAAHLLNHLALAEMSVARPMGQQPVSRGFLAAAIRTAIRRIPVTASLRLLRRAFDGPIIAQPFPLPTPGVLQRDDCSLAEQYGPNAGALLSFYYTQQHAALQEIANELGADTTLLPYPDTAWLEQGFTPADLAQGNDCWHMNAAHGERVLGQIRAALAQPVA